MTVLNAPQQLVEGIPGKLGEAIKDGISNPRGYLLAGNDRGPFR